MKNPLKINCIALTISFGIALLSAVSMIASSFDRNRIRFFCCMSALFFCNAALYLANKENCVNKVNKEKDSKINL